MTLILSVLTALLISPLFFAALVAVGIRLDARGRKKASRWLLASATFLLLALSTQAGGNLLLRPLEGRYPPWTLAGNAKSVDAVVVLGGGVRDAAPDEGGRSALGEASLSRLVAAYTLSRQLGVPVIFSGGRLWKAGGGESEADVAARMLEKMGLPPSMVIREGESGTTWQNAREVSLRVRGTGIRRVALVTSAWHMPRAVLAFRRAGMDFIPAPTHYLSEWRGLLLRDFLPTFQSLRNSTLALREYLGILDYSLRR